MAQMREQKSAFLKKNGGDSSKVNKVSLKAEGLMNEASMMASQGEHEEGIKLLVKAYEVLTASLKSIGVR